MTFRPMSNAAGYIRVSTEGQASSGTSLEGQLEVIGEYAKAKGVRLIQTFKDPGESGATLERPGLEALREEVRKQNIDTIIVSSLDRLTRKSYDLGRLLQEFDDNGVRLVSLQDAYVTGPQGVDSSRPEDRRTIETLVTYAQWQREQTSIATIRGQQRRLAQGKAPNHPMYGFEADKEKNLHPLDDELRVLLDMKRWAEMGAGSSGIASLLNARGTPSKMGGEWSAKTVADQLENLQKYAGIYEPHFDRLKSP